MSMAIDYTNPETVVFSLSVEDIQDVAEQTLDRELTPEEVERVALSFGEWIKCDDAVYFAMADIGLPAAETDPVDEI